jgi:hypothetical protein
MLRLSPKKEWEIAFKLSEQVEIGNWKEIAAQAEIDPRNIPARDSDTAMCYCIVQETNKMGKLIDYLKAVIRHFRHDNGLGKIIAELEIGGYGNRISKLVKAIRSRQCILFLGPGALVVDEDDEKKTFNQKFSLHLANQLKNSRKYYDPSQEENVNYMVQRYNKATEAGIGEAGGEASALFLNYRERQLLDENIFKQLAVLPWSLVINTNPDTILGELLNMGNEEKCLIRKYNLTSYIDKSTNQGAPVDDQCMFYNLFGTFGEPASILLSDVDFIRFNDKVTKGKPRLNEYVTAMFDPLKEYLFLGFDFDQWYFKVLFKALNLEKDKAVSWHPSTHKFNEWNTEFFEEEYKFHFVNDNIDTFLKYLSESYGSV